MRAERVERLRGRRAFGERRRRVRRRYREGGQRLVARPGGVQIGAYEFQEPLREQIGGGGLEQVGVVVPDQDHPLPGPLRLTALRSSGRSTTSRSKRVVPVLNPS
ncbi:hypothetical protein SALBM311S_09853 [Streptomyces alboniger]